MLTSALDMPGRTKDKRFKESAEDVKEDKGISSTAAVEVALRDFELDASQTQNGKEGLMAGWRRAGRLLWARQQ